MSDFVANTSTGPRNQRQNMGQYRGFSGRKLRNYEELLKGPGPKHSTLGAPSAHSWENCFVMQEFCLQASRDHQGGKVVAIHVNLVRAGHEVARLAISLIWVLRGEAVRIITVVSRLARVISSIMTKAVSSSQQSGRLSEQS